MNLFRKYYFQIIGVQVIHQYDLHPECLYDDFVLAVDLDEARRKAYDEFLFHYPEIASSYHWWSTVEEVKV